MTIPSTIPSLDLLTDAMLDALRAEEKKKASGTRTKEKMGHLQQQFDLVASADHERQFTIFTRVSATKPDVFSVGLTLVLPDRHLILCRYNSGHHGHRNMLERERMSAVPHRHVATERYIAAGLDPDGWAEEMTGYATLEEALAKLVRDCNVQGILRPSEPPPEPPAPSPQQPLFPSS